MLCKLLFAVASLAAEHRPRACGLQWAQHTGSVVAVWRPWSTSFSARVQLLHGLWSLPGPMSPGLADECLSTVPPGKLNLSLLLYKKGENECEGPMLLLALWVLLTLLYVTLGEHVKGSHGQYWFSWMVAEDWTSDLPESLLLPHLVSTTWLCPYNDLLLRMPHCIDIHLLQTHNQLSPMWSPILLD